MKTKPMTMLLAMLAGWINREQQQVIEYLKAENGILKDELLKATGKKRIDSSPVIAGNRVYFGSEAGRVHALDVASGKEVWQYETGGGFASSPAIAEGKLVIASDDGVVYCFGSQHD